LEYNVICTKKVNRTFKVLLPSGIDYNVRDLYNKELRGYDFND